MLREETFLFPFGSLRVAGVVVGLICTAIALLGLERIGLELWAMKTSHPTAWEVALFVLFPIVAAPLFGDMIDRFGPTIAGTATVSVLGLVTFWVSSGPIVLFDTSPRSLLAPIFVCGVSGLSVILLHTAANQPGLPSRGWLYGCLLIVVIVSRPLYGQGPSLVTSAQGAWLDAGDVATLVGAAALAFAVCLRPAALQASTSPPRLSSDLGMAVITALMGFAEAVSGIPQAFGLPPPTGGHQPFDPSILHAITAVCAGIALGSFIAHRWGPDALTPLLLFHAAWMVFLGADDLYRFVPEAPMQDFLGSVETRMVDLVLLVNNVMLGPVLVV